MKKDNTIKQAAEEWVDNMFGSGETMGQECFVAGAELQAEQSGKMFTEQDMANAYQKGADNALNCCDGHDVEFNNHDFLKAKQYFITQLKQDQ